MENKRADWYVWWIAKNGIPTSGTFSGMMRDDVFETIERENHFPGTEITIQEIV